MTRRPQPKPRAVRRQERRAARAAGQVRERRPRRWLPSLGGEPRNRRIPPFVWPLLALGLLATIPFLALEGYHGVQSQHLVDRSEICAPSGDTGGDCLVAVGGQLDGPYSPFRSWGHDHWHLVVDDERVDEFSLAEVDESRVLPVCDQATALVQDGHVVAVVLTDGSTVPVWDVGWRGATLMTLFALLCLGCAVMALQFGLRRRRATGSWWRVHGPYASPGSLPAAAILIPATLALLALAVFPWWLCLVLLGAGLIAAALLLVGSMPTPAGMRPRFEQRDAPID